MLVVKTLEFEDNRLKSVSFESGTPDEIIKFLHRFRIATWSEEEYEHWMNPNKHTASAKLTAPEGTKVLSADRWVSSDGGKTWSNPARPGESIESDPHPNLTGQYIVDKDGKIVAQARGM